MTKRDNFTKKTIEILAKRVGYRCSNPNCRILTSGPGKKSSDTINIGVASHITAASQGGPRYDSSLTQDQRRSPENGIWLCQIHGKLVDDDSEKYTIDILKAWKRLSEEAACLEIENLDKNYQKAIAEDIDVLRIFSLAFDRPAFKNSFNNEYNIRTFEQAIQDTVIAISTGCLRDRNGKVLKQTKGRMALNNINWQNKFGIILDILNAISRRLADAVKSNDVNNNDVCSWMDSSKIQVLQIFSSILQEAGLPEISFRKNLRYNPW